MYSLLYNTVDNNYIADTQQREDSTKLSSASIRLNVQAIKTVKNTAISTDSISQNVYFQPDAKEKLVEANSTTQFYSFRYAAIDTIGLDQYSSSPSYLHSSTTKDINRYEGIPLPIHLERTDLTLGLLLLCFFIFAHIYSGRIAFFKENIRLLFSLSSTKRANKEKTTKDILSIVFLLLQSILIVSVGLFYIFIRYNSTSNDTQPTLSKLLSFGILLISFYLLKIGIYKLLGFIFEIQQASNSWIRTNLFILQILGFAYFPLTLLFVYADTLQYPILISMLILFIVIEILFFYQVACHFLHKKFNYLFLIAYLCSVELIPMLYVAIGLNYLYRIDTFKMLWL